MENTSISLKNVSFAYKSDYVLNDINITLSSQGICIIYGDNGAGKTTLLRLMAGFIVPNLGSIKYNKDLKQSFIFQKPVLLRRSVRENLQHALIINNKLSKSEAIKHADNTLSRYGLSNISKEFTFNISGGQRQMVSILRALITKPNIIYCDEPTSNLDSKNKLLVEEILAEESKKSRIVLITQDQSLSNKTADGVYILKDTELKKT